MAAGASEGEAEAGPPAPAVWAWVPKPSKEEELRAFNPTGDAAGRVSSESTRRYVGGCESAVFEGTRVQESVSTGRVVRSITWMHSSGSDRFNPHRQEARE